MNGFYHIVYSSTTIDVVLDESVACCLSDGEVVYFTGNCSKSSVQMTGASSEHRILKVALMKAAPEDITVIV
jgi:hypothetical protein